MLVEVLVRVVVRVWLVLDMVLVAVDVVVAEVDVLVAVFVVTSGLTG